MSRAFQGVIPALITPFLSDGSFDGAGFRNNIEALCEHDISSIVPCGSTGESATLSFDEHKSIIEVAVDASSVPIIAGTGSNSTHEAVELTRHAEDVGADAALVITPYYNKPTPSGMIKHFTAVAEAVDIPIILYNVPSRTGIDLKPETVIELAKIDNITGIKEASGDVERVGTIMRETADISPDFSVYSGDDALTMPIMSMGGSGVISVTANIDPARMIEMVRCFTAGDIKKAREIHFKLVPLYNALFCETNPIPVKRASGLIGHASGPLRLPLTDMSQANEGMLKEVLQGLGLL
ncbi:MAG: 4-hydroxy-tetrahydrodipicolinate synthase [Methanosarcinales archaeon]|nr:4-hydroxy-tetrahydrodipicolinate synthase [Methanosarcinales archaeon]